jgi:hypothetical protein
LFDVCPGCGAYTPEKAVDPAGPFAVCALCGHRHRFLQLPLFVVTGPSGGGKTAACLALVSTLTSCVVLESDVLWGAVPATPDDGYRGYLDIWLRVVISIHQSGRPVAIFGTFMPDPLERCIHRRYIGPTHYLGLVCDDDVLAARLRARPAWRNADSDAFVAEMLRYNRWLKEHAAMTTPPIILFDTGACTLDVTARYIMDWVSARL